MAAGDAAAPLVLVARLFVRPGHEEDFRRFETEAARLVRRHGGALERVIRCEPPAVGLEAPHEVHLLSFPSAEALAAYRADPALAALAPLRARAILRTEITTGRDRPPY
jgi:uncharacterized protein (DUF1330 family)